MKLSEKGYLKIGNSIVGWFENGVVKVTFDPDKIEFEPDDFQGVVVLTAEEAKEIAKKLNDVGLQHEVDFGDYDYDALDLADCLSERIG